MTPSKLNVAYSYSWVLTCGEVAEVRAIIESLRQFAIDLGSESVSDLIVLAGNDAQAIRSGANHVIMFTATIPNTKAEGGPQNFGLGFSPEENAWTWSGTERVSSFKEVSSLMVHAASLGIFVSTMFAGMVMEYRKNAQGVIEVKQRSAFDLTDF